MLIVNYLRIKMKLKLLIVVINLINVSMPFSVLNEGDICFNRDRVQGVCKLFSQCTTALPAIKRKKIPKTCTFIHNEPVVCCPPERNLPSQEFNTLPQNPTRRPSKPVSSVGPDRFNAMSRTNVSNAIQIAKEKCREYAKSVVEYIADPVGFSNQKIPVDHCARIETPLIINGENAKANEFPHMALIGYKDTDIKWLCGGSLISERFVLSAAHCSNSHLGHANWVKLGELDTSTEADDAAPVIIRIIERIDHPNYHPPKLYYDITLFRLHHSVTFNAHIRPICLSTELDTHLKTGIATGWGLTSFESSEGSSALQKVTLNFASSKRCNIFFDLPKYKSSLPSGIIGSQICAGGDSDRRDTCKGDSGGPLQSPLNEPYCMYQIIGVTSFGKKCGMEIPGVYTRIAYFLPWIVENVWPE